MGDMTILTFITDKLTINGAASTWNFSEPNMFVNYDPLSSIGFFTSGLFESNGSSAAAFVLFSANTINGNCVQGMFDSSYDS